MEAATFFSLDTTKFPTAKSSVSAEVALYPSNVQRLTDPNRVENLRVAKRELQKLTNLGPLFPAATNIVVSNPVQVSFLVLALDGIAL